MAIGDGSLLAIAAQDQGLWIKYRNRWIGFGGRQDNE